MPPAEEITARPRLRLWIRLFDRGEAVRPRYELRRRGPPPRPEPISDHALRRAEYFNDRWVAEKCAELSAAELGCPVVCVDATNPTPLQLIAGGRRDD